MKKVLFVRPNYDKATHYLFHWCNELIQYAESRGFHVIKLDNEKANTKDVQSSLKKVRPQLLSLNGHGTSESFQGHRDAEVITVKSAHLLADTITFVRACECAANLGQVAVAQGCQAFIGYLKPFWLATQNEMFSRPLEDPIAAPILHSSNAVMIGLLKGETAGSSVRASHAMSAKKITELLFSNDTLIAAALPCLVYNDKSLTLHGNENACLK